MYTEGRTVSTERRMIPIFPFTAIVGQNRMKRALVLNAISPQIGGVLIRGERGTAKSTAARALASLLPEIEVVEGCPFNCDPSQPESLCDLCRDRHSQGERLPTARQQTRFVDLPVSATEDRVVGTLDIEQAIKRGERHFEPGVLAAANRGLLYVDEVNLLDDHVVDLLLDSAAMGVNVVEREGISFSHPSRFILVGTMNPEEGELRPQLLDRFALCVEIKGIADREARVEILRRRVQYERDPIAFREEWRTAEEALTEKIVRAKRFLPRVRHTSDDLYAIAQLTTEMEVDGHRGDIVILKTATVHAAFEGRETIGEMDILLAAELALPHRLKRRPLQEVETKLESLRTRLQSAQSEPREGPAADEDAKKKLPLDAASLASPLPAAGGTPLRGHHVDPLPPSLIRQADVPVESGPTFRPRKLETPLDRLARHTAGKRSFTHTNRKRGRYVSSRPARPGDTDVAFDATLREAAPHQVHRAHEGVALAVDAQDLRTKVRVRRAANLVLFVVDASWSMAAERRMVATKGAILSLLVDAYQKRDQVSLITFQRESAKLVLPPTSSVELAKKALGRIPVGGKTPLTSGLLLAHRTIVCERRKNPEVMPLLILLTDGAGNVSLMGETPEKEAHMVARYMKQDFIRSVVINTEHESLDRGLAQGLADALGAPCYTLVELGAQELYHTVRGEMR